MSRDCQSAMITFLGGSSVASGVQKIAAHPKHVDLQISMPHRINDLRRLVQTTQSVGRATKRCVALGKVGESARIRQHSAVSGKNRHALLNQIEPTPRISKLS